MIRAWGKNRNLSKTELKYAVQWMLEDLIGRRALSRLSINIRQKPLKKTRTGEQLKGQVVAHDDYTYSIDIDCRLPRREQLLTLAHEAIHVKQYATRELVAHPEHTPHRPVMRWKRTRVVREKVVEYRSLPWEREAFNRESKVRRKYERHLRRHGIDFTLLTFV